MDPVTVAFLVECGAHQLPQSDLGLRVLRAYERHDLAALLFGKDVGHLPQEYPANHRVTARYAQLDSSRIPKI